MQQIIKLTKFKLVLQKSQYFYYYFQGNQLSQKNFQQGVIISFNHNPH